MSDVPDDVLNAIDSRAAKLGLSRTEHFRRRLAQEATASGSVTREDLQRLGDAIADLADPQVMAQGWS
jgi:hypothetical protein